MSESAHTSDSRAVLLVGAAGQEVSRLQNEMPGWLWEEAPDDWPFNLKAEPAGGAFDAVIVFARKNEEDRAIETCRLLCGNKSIEGVLLLVAASRYQMSLVNRLRKLPQVHFVFTPIDKNTLLDKMNESINAIS
jgi:hypothetical protein